MNIKKRITCCLQKSGITQKELASRIGKRQASLSVSLTNGKFTKEELETMAKAMGCEYVSYFKFSDEMVSGKDIDTQVRRALIKSGMSMTALALHFGVAQPTMSTRLKRGRLTQDELEKVATVLNCEYVSQFKYLDGEII